MIIFVLILISIVNFANGGGDEQEPTNYSAHNYRNMINSPIVSDIGPFIWSNIDTVKLIQMIYHPIGSNVHKQQIAQELHKRVKALNPNTFKENMRLFSEIDRQRAKGNTLPHYAEGIEKKIASDVQMDVQRRLNEMCNSDYCDLSMSGEPLVNNWLLKTLARFHQQIVVPTHVKTLMLCGGGLTSLWLRFEEDSEINHLDLRNNAFEELNHETFGQYIHEAIRMQKLRHLYVGYNAKIRMIDFDQMEIPNLQYLMITDCCSLCDVKNIPTTLRSIWLNRTGEIQLDFKQENGNDLRLVACDAEDGEEYQRLLTKLHPGGMINVQEQNIAMGRKLKILQVL